MVRGLFDVRHHFEIDLLGDDRSRLRQFEQFSGVLEPFMRGVLRETQAAFKLANKAIKQRAESLPEDRGNNIADASSRTRARRFRRRPVP